MEHFYLVIIIILFVLAILHKCRRATLSGLDRVISVQE